MRKEELYLPEEETKVPRKQTSIRVEMELWRRFHKFVTTGDEETGESESKNRHIQLALQAYLDQAEEAEGDVAQCPVCKSVVFNEGLAERLIPKEHEEAVRLLVESLSSDSEPLRQFAASLVQALGDCPKR